MCGSAGRCRLSDWLTVSDSCAEMPIDPCGRRWRCMAMNECVLGHLSTSRFVWIHIMWWKNTFNFVHRHAWLILRVLVDQNAERKPCHSRQSSSHRVLPRYPGAPDEVDLRAKYVSVLNKDARTQVSFLERASVGLGRPGRLVCPKSVDEEQFH